MQHGPQCQAGIEDAFAGDVLTCISQGEASSVPGSLDCACCLTVITLWDTWHVLLVPPVFFPAVTIQNVCCEKGPVNICLIQTVRGEYISYALSRSLHSDHFVHGLSVSMLLWRPKNIYINIMHEMKTKANFFPTVSCSSSGGLQRESCVCYSSGFSEGGGSSWTPQWDAWPNKKKQKKNSETENPLTTSSHRVLWFSSVLPLKMAVLKKNHCRRFWQRPESTSLRTPADRWRCCESGKNPACLRTAPLRPPPRLYFPARVTRCSQRSCSCPERSACGRSCRSRGRSSWGKWSEGRAARPAPSTGSGWPEEGAARRRLWAGGCPCSAWAAPRHPPGWAPLPPRWWWSYSAAAGAWSCPVLRGDTCLNYEQPSCNFRYTVYFSVSHNYLFLGTLFSPFAVCRIWHIIQLEALKKHPDPEGGTWKHTNITFFFLFFWQKMCVLCSVSCFHL